MSARSPIALAVLAVALALGVCAFLSWSPRPAGIASAAPDEMRVEGLAVTSAAARAPAVLEPAGIDVPELATAREVAAVAPLAENRHPLDAVAPEHALVVSGRAVDRAGRAVAKLVVAARVHDASEDLGEWIELPDVVRARAPTDADGRFELWIESAAVVARRRVALRLHGLGEESFGGPGFVVACPGAPEFVAGLRTDEQRCVYLGDLRVRAQDRLVASGRFELANGVAVPGTSVTSTVTIDGRAVAFALDLDTDPTTNALRIRHNLRGDFATYADDARGARFELACAVAGRPRPRALGGACGATGLRVVFPEWARVSGTVLADLGEQREYLRVECRVDSASGGDENPQPPPARLDAQGRFEFPHVPAGRCALRIVSLALDPDAAPFAALDVRWGEQRELGALDLRGDWTAGRLDVRDALGRPASGWAVVEPGDRATFGFVRELSTALPASTRRVHVYVPGHRVASVEWPPHETLLVLDEGPLLDLGFGACGPCCMNERGLDLDLEPVAFDDPGARHFAHVMRLLPVSCANRASVRLPCAGTYRLSCRPQRRSEIAALTRSYDIDVPLAGRSFDP
jgi:hypothetical protein